MFSSMSIFLEIGPGRGDFLFWLAEQNPLASIAAVEYKKKRFDKLGKRIEVRKIQNISLYFGDARLVLPQEFADESVERIYILFSDPWPKRKHAHHRLFQEDFVKELLRILKSEGRIYIAHDNPDYVAQIREVFRGFISSFVAEDERVDFPTFYAEKWLAEGRTLTSFSYRKIDCKSDRDGLALPCAEPNDATIQDA
jgi:tRNA (guanine-N7-)-methyltransferase